MYFAAELGINMHLRMNEENSLAHFQMKPCQSVSRFKPNSKGNYGENDATA